MALAIAVRAAQLCMRSKGQRGLAMLPTDTARA